MSTPVHIELIILGSGTRVLLDERSMAGYALLCGNFFLLLDCGNGVIRRGLQAKLPLLQIDAILITHLHMDHIADLPSLLWALHGEGHCRAKRPLSIYGPSGLKDFYSGLINLYGTWIEEIEPEVRVIEVEVQDFPVGPWEIKTLPMQHGLPANGYRLEQGNKIITYTGDTGPCDQVIKLAKDASVCIIECSFPDGMETTTHLTASEVGKLAEKANCRKIILSHLYPESLSTDIIGQCRHFFKGEIEIASDLKRLTFQ